MKSFYSNAYIGLQYLLFVIFMITGNKYSIWCSTLLGISFLIAFITSAKLYKGVNVTKVCSVILISMFLNLGFVENLAFLDIIREITIYFSLGLAIYILDLNRKFSLYLFYVIAAIMAYGVIRMGNEFMEKSSVNYVSVILIIALLPYFKSFMSKSERPSMVPVVICALICIISIGRGGILMGLSLLLGLSIVSIFVYKTSSKWNLIFYLVPAIFIVYLVVFTSYFDEYLWRFFMDDGGFQDGARETIMETYFGLLNQNENLLFGVHISSVSTFVHYLNNLHNSYLMLHANMGLLGVILLMAFSIKGMIVLYKKREYDMLVFFLAFFLRSFTDWVFPLQMGSVLLYYLALSGINSKQTTLHSN